MKEGENKVLKKINLSQKNVALVCAHCDDESIFASSLLTNKDLKSLSIYILFEPGKRLEAIKNVAALCNASLKVFTLPLIPHASGKTHLAPVTKETKQELYQILSSIIESNPDVIFTHNAAGEYGHIHHLLIHENLKSLLVKNTEVYCFGFLPPLYSIGNLKKYDKNLNLRFPFSLLNKKANVKENEESHLDHYSPALKKTFKLKLEHYLELNDLTLLDKIQNSYQGIEDWWISDKNILWLYSRLSIQPFSKL